MENKMEQDAGSQFTAQSSKKHIVGLVQNCLIEWH